MIREYENAEQQAERWKAAADDRNHPNYDMAWGGMLSDGPMYQHFEEKAKKLAPDLLRLLSLQKYIEETAASL